MAHMVEKGQPIWQKRDMSEPLAHKGSWLFFLWKKSEKDISVYSSKNVKKSFYYRKNNVFSFFFVEITS